MATNIEVIEGLIILNKYVDNPFGGYDIVACHEQIWHGPDSIRTNVEPNEDGEYPILPVTGEDQPISEVDQRRLKELGWFFDSGCDRWSCYV